MALKFSQLIVKFINLDTSRDRYRVYKILIFDKVRPIAVMVALFRILESYTHVTKCVLDTADRIGTCIKAWINPPNPAMSLANLARGI